MPDWLTRRKAAAVFDAMVGDCGDTHRWGKWKIETKKTFLRQRTYIQKRQCQQCHYCEWNKQVVDYGF